MSAHRTEAFAPALPKAEEDEIGFFERYLSAWVALCMAAGILLGKLLPALTHAMPIRSPSDCPPSLSSTRLMLNSSDRKNE